MGLFLEAIRKRVTGVISGLRAFTLNLATRPRLIAGKPIQADDDYSARTVSAGSRSKSASESATVQPTIPTASLVSDDAFTQTIEPDPAATRNVSSSLTERQDAIQLEAARRQSGGPADDVIAPTTTIDSPEDEVLSSGEPRLQRNDRHEFPEPQPVLAVAAWQPQLSGDNGEMAASTAGGNGAGTALAHIEPEPVTPPPVQAEPPSGEGAEAEAAIEGEVAPEAKKTDTLAPLEPPLSPSTGDALPSEYETTGTGAAETALPTAPRFAEVTVEPELAAAQNDTLIVVPQPPSPTPPEFQSSAAGEILAGEPVALAEPRSAPVGEIADIEHSERAAVHPPATKSRRRDSTQAAQRRAKARQRPSRPSTESYEQPFVDPRLPPPSDEYAVWNNAVVQHCLLQDATEGQDVYLTITPRILARALSEAVDLTLAPEDAEVRFAGAVSTMYRRRVLTHSRKLQVVRRCGEDGLPECAALLALSVLAAYRMHTDEGAAANAYYKRLDELLLCGVSGGLPRGFDPDEFEGLWLFLRAWLDREHGLQLAMPGSDVGLRRFVALPLTHVPLRQVDIERLPDFFDWGGYEPGARASTERINTDLFKWARVRGAFTKAGMDALADDRRLAVLAQVSHELECWDGSHTDSPGMRTAPVEVFLEWERRIPKLSYLPRRPAAFPEVFDDGVHIFEAGQDGWYETLPMGVEDGPELAGGFAWEAASNGLRTVLRRAGASAIAMAPSDFAGPVSHNGLLLGASGAALCRDALVVPARQYIESVTGQRCLPVRPPNTPAGWTLFTGIKPVRRLPPPGGLEVLEIVANIEIIPQGGLRVGRRWAWLAEAPPTLLATGFEPGEYAAIDGDPVEVDEGCVIRDEGRLATPGIHVVEVGRLRRRLEIINPELTVASLGNIVAADLDRWRVVALPLGSWTVIGPRPGDLAHAMSRSRGQGALAGCAFSPVWAISFGSGHGAVVLSLSEQVRAPDRPSHCPAARSLRRIRLWADVVYNAHIRHPAFGASLKGVLHPGPFAVWAEYVRTAKEIKRRLKAERR